MQNNEIFSEYIDRLAQDSEELTLPSVSHLDRREEMLTFQRYYATFQGHLLGHGLEQFDTVTLAALRAVMGMACGLVSGRVRGK